MTQIKFITSDDFSVLFLSPLHAGLCLVKHDNMHRIQIKLQSKKCHKLLKNNWNIIIRKKEIRLGVYVSENLEKREVNVKLLPCIMQSAHIAAVCLPPKESIFVREQYI